MICDGMLTMDVQISGRLEVLERTNGIIQAPSNEWLVDCVSFGWPGFW